MHRAILQACLPWFFWLCVASGLVLFLVQFCGSRIDWRRLRHLSRGEEGSVQSLSLVLTLPVFLMLVLFIVQVTQLMVGIMMVHYAAFAAARAASVWIPADVTMGTTFVDPPFDDPQIDIDFTAYSAVGDRIIPKGSIDVASLQGPLEAANVLGGRLNDEEANELLKNGYAVMDEEKALRDAQNGAVSYKYQKVMMAGIIPCLTISPSRNTGTDLELPYAFQNTYYALTKLYPQVDPRSQSNLRMPRRLFNKLSYAAKHTTVTLKWENVAHPVRDIVDGPTYNPWDHPAIASGAPPWKSNEIGFRDPITVSVSHDFALLPGIGRIMWYAFFNDDAAKKEESEDGDRTAGSVTDKADSDLYTVKLEASATFVNEGFKSLVRYAVRP